MQWTCHSTCFACARSASRTSPNSPWAHGERRRCRTQRGRARATPGCRGGFRECAGAGAHRTRAARTTLSRSCSTAAGRRACRDRRRRRAGNGSHHGRRRAGAALDGSRAHRGGRAGGCAGGVQPYRGCGRSGRLSHSARAFRGGGPVVRHVRSDRRCGGQGPAGCSRMRTRPPEVAGRRANLAARSGRSRGRST